MADLTLHLFGTPRLLAHGVWRTLSNERPCQLLVYLALRGGWVRRDGVAALLWPEHDHRSARRNLRKVLHDARAAPWHCDVEAEGESVRWRAESDVVAFAAALSQGQAHAAGAIYGGLLCDALDDGAAVDAWSQWLLAERQRLHDQWRVAVLQLIATEPAQSALRLSRRLRTFDALDEEALRCELRALHTLGRSVEANHVYRAFAERLADDLGIEVSTQTRDFAQALREPAMPAPALVATQPLAPVETIDAFFGRRRELGQLSSLLAQADCRLLTITGPGGIGKSRLAKEAIRQLGPQFPDGIVWLALDDLDRSALVLPRLARELGVTVPPQGDALRCAAERLAGRRVLVVMDNSEHLPELGPLVAALLQAAPALVLLCTSRTRLGIAGEWLLPLGGLDVPPAGIEKEAAIGFDASRLFIAAARSAQPGFDGLAHADGVTTLVRAVGGMPLAILLAAHWVRVLPVAELAQEVSHSLELLERDEEGEERPEHRSVRATFEQSWRLLSPHEQRALTGLSAFACPFTRAAAKEVAAATLPLLSALLDKSLLQADRGGRFSLHPLVRQFSSERPLMQSDFALAVQRRHTAFFCRAAAAIDPWHSADQKQAIATMTAEQADWLAAFRRALAEWRADQVQPLAAALGYFYEHSGSRIDEGLTVLEEAERTLTEPLRAHWQARAQAAKARSLLLYRVARFDACVREAKLALQLFRGAHDGTGIRDAVSFVAAGLIKLGAYEQAVRYCEQGLRLATQGNDREGMAACLNNLGQIESQRGDPGAAVARYERSLQLCRELGHVTGVLAVLNNLSTSYLWLGEPARALGLLHEAMSVCDDAGFFAQRSYFQANTAQAHFDLHDFAAAERYARDGLEAVRNGSDRTSQPGCLIVLGRIALEQGRLDDAHGLLVEAIDAAESMHLQRFRVRGLMAYSAWCERTGALDQAVRLLSCLDAPGAANALERTRVAPILDRARALLGDDAFGTAMAQGRALSLEAAVAEVTAR